MFPTGVSMLMLSILQGELSFEFESLYIRPHDIKAKSVYT